MAKIAIVLTEGFADWEYSLIGGADGPFYGLDIEYFAPSPGELRPQGGLRVVVPKGMNDFASWRPDVVAIIGGTIWETDQAPDVFTLLQT